MTRLLFSAIIMLSLVLSGGIQLPRITESLSFTSVAEAAPPKPRTPPKSKPAKPPKKKLVFKKKPPGKAKTGKVSLRPATGTVKKDFRAGSGLSKNFNNQSIRASKLLQKKYKYKSSRYDQKYVHPFMNGRAAKLSADTKRALDRFQKGEIGKIGRELSPKLAKMTRRQFEEFMGKQVAQGKATVFKNKYTFKRGEKIIRGNQRIYEYPDGTVVRYKAKGDARRQHPTYSVEVKKTPGVRDLKSSTKKLLPNGKDFDRQYGIAFKLNKKGIAMPKGPSQMQWRQKHPDKKIDIYMDLVHHGFRKE